MIGLTVFYSQLGLIGSVVLIVITLVILRILARREERHRLEAYIPRVVWPDEEDDVFDWDGLAVPPPPCSLDQDLAV